MKTGCRILHGRNFLYCLFTIGLVLILTGCTDQSSSPAVTSHSVSGDPVKPAPEENPDVPEESGLSSASPVEETLPDKSTQPSRPAPTYDYNLLRKKISYGKATLADVRKALTDPDTAGLTNTVHALYGMRWHRGVVNLLHDMWKLDREKYPELAWDKLAVAPARLALASTINRIQIVHTDEYLDYIRAHRKDEHEFHVAQVAVALGFNGDPMDIPYLQALGESDNSYIAQSAITGLALMGGDQARDALVALNDEFRDDARSKLISELLKKAYDWPETN